MPIEASVSAVASGARVDGTPLDSAAINGWRGPGAVAIALAHLGVATDIVAVRRLLPVALLVDLFFVLSGLVIAQAYATKLSRAASIPEYIVRRFGRIWPVQAATLAVLVAYESTKAILEALGYAHFSTPAFSRDGIALAWAIPTNLLLVHSLGIHDRETWNFPSWSLSVEFATYVAFAFFCLMTPMLRRTLSVVTVVASLAVLALVAPYGMRSTFDYGIFRCLAGFFAGTLCYEVAQRWPLPRWRYPTLVEVAALAFVIAWLAMAAGSWAGYAAPLVFALFVLAFLGRGGRLSRLLRSHPMQVFADLSFSIYMVHALVLLVLLAFARAWGSRHHVSLFQRVPNPLADLPGAHATVDVLHVEGIWAALGLVAVYLAGVAILTLLAYSIVEVPGRTLFNRLAKRLSRLATPARGGATFETAERAP